MLELQTIILYERAEPRRWPPDTLSTCNATTIDNLHRLIIRSSQAPGSYLYISVHHTPHASKNPRFRPSPKQAIGTKRLKSCPCIFCWCYSKKVFLFEENVGWGYTHFHFSLLFSWAGNQRIPKLLPIAFPAFVKVLNRSQRPTYISEAGSVEQNGVESTAPDSPPVTGYAFPHSGPGYIKIFIKKS